jgi:hypothetical protein
MTNEVWLILGFAIFVIALLVFVGILNIINRNLGITFINEWFHTSQTPNAPEAVVLQKAIQCSYYRCIYGCSSDQVKQVQYSFGGVSFDCSQFCKPEYTDTKTADGKVCDDNSKNNPVTAEVVSSNGEKISIDKLGFSPCMVESDTCGGQSGGAPFIFVQKSAITENTETTIQCGTQLKPVQNTAFNTAVMNQGKYQIWTTSGQGWSGDLTYVCSVGG